MQSSILNHPEVDRLIQLALDEDGVAHDLTAIASCSDPDAELPIRATIVAKKATIAAGYPIVERILRTAGMEKTIKASTLVSDGTSLNAKSPWMIFEGSATS